MFNAAGPAILSVMDFLLGWMLYLPRDLVLVMLALATALLLTLVRLVTTNQDFLKRCKHDRARLKQLIRQARANGDKEALARHRATVQMIGLGTLKAELKPLLASIVPIAFLAIWAFSRIAYLPVAPGEPVTVRAYFPTGSIGQLVHVMPTSGIEAPDGWVRRIEPDRQDQAAVNGAAQWRLKCTDRMGSVVLHVRCAGKTFDKEMICDGVRYAEPVAFYADPSIEAIEVVLPEYRLFGVVPGVAFLHLPAWMVGYLVIVIPLSLVLKPLLRIC